MVATAKAKVRNGAGFRQLEGTLPDSFERLELDVVRCLYSGVLPDALLPATPVMDEMWRLHPSSVPGATRARSAPCWQQAYGWPYRYCNALPVPQVLEPLLAWARDAIDPRLNGACLNWYDADLGHYMALHRDVTKGLVKGAPIVTVSLGASRVFRWKPWWPGDVLDILTGHGSVLVIPCETNSVWRHGVLHRPSDTGRRISITFRAFENPARPLRADAVVNEHLPTSADPNQFDTPPPSPLMEPVVLAASQGAE